MRILVISVPNGTVFPPVGAEVFAVPRLEHLCVLMIEASAAEPHWPRRSPSRSRQQQRKDEQTTKTEKDFLTTTELCGLLRNK